MTTLNVDVLRALPQPRIAAFAGPFTGFVTNLTALAKSILRNLLVVPDSARNVA